MSAFLGQSLKLYRLWGISKSKAVPEITTNFTENKQGVHINTVNPQWAALIIAKSLQSCPTLCDPIDGSSPGSSAHGIFQAGVLEWGAIDFSLVTPEWGSPNVQHFHHCRKLCLTG